MDGSPPIGYVPPRGFGLKLSQATLLLACVFALVLSAPAHAAGPDWGAVAADATGGQLIVVQDAQPNSAEAVTFNAGGGLTPATFQLDDAGAGPLPNSQTFNDVPPGSGYSVSQVTPSSFDPPQVDCSDGSDPSNIDISLGESVTCTFVNVQADAGFVLIRKDTQPDSGQDFSFFGLPTATRELILDDDGTAADPPNEVGMYVDAGTYSLRERQVSGFVLASATCSDGSPVYELVVSPDETVTCTWVNQAAPTGWVQVKVDAQPDDFQDFNFTAGGGLNSPQEPASFHVGNPGSPPIITDKNFTTVPVGSGYSVTPTTPEGWSLVSATCSDGSPVSNIDVSAGEFVSCTFTNRKHARLTITQDTQPDDPQDFTFNVGGGVSPSSFALDDDGDDGNGTSSSRTFDDVPPGTYSVGQAAPSGWSRFFGTCSNGSPISSVSIAMGERVTCNFGNTPVGQPPPASGTGAGGNRAQGQNPSLSADGRYLAFGSTATNLSPDDTSSSLDIYVRDLRTGDVRLVTRATGVSGVKANATADNPVISADGRYVTFATASTNLSPDDTDTLLDVYVRDLVANTTTLVSRASGAAGAKASGSSGAGPAISGDGRFVVFSNNATNLSPDDPDTLNDVYVRDLQANTTTLVSRATGAPGTKGNSQSVAPVISADGGYVAFSSTSTNLSPDDSDSLADIYRRDLQTSTTTLVSRATGAGGAKANQGSSSASISADGSTVEFSSQATNLDPDDLSTPSDLYVRDLDSDVTLLVDRASGATGAKQNLSLGGEGSISGDGRYVAFTTSARNLHPDDVTNTVFDVYLRDIVNHETFLVSRTTGAQGGAGNLQSLQQGGHAPALSGDGRFVAFISLATNFSPDAVGSSTSVYVRDRETQVTSLESRSSPTYARPKAATPIDAPLVPAYATCTSPNRVHAVPLNHGSCNPP